MPTKSDLSTSAYINSKMNYINTKKGVRTQIKIKKVRNDKKINIVVTKAIFWTWWGHFG